MSRFWSSDFHFDHFNLTSHPKSRNYCNRPWKSIDEMNEALVERFNSRVTKEDDVYFLGDFNMGKVSGVEKWLPELNFKNFYWIVGNHDRAFKGMKNLQLRQRLYGIGVTKLYYYKEIEIGGIKVGMSHLPYRPKEASKHDDLRYLSRRPKDKGKILLHGHCHSTPQNKIRLRQIDVGVDAWNYYPVSEEELLTEIRKMV